MKRIPPHAAVCAILVATLVAGCDGADSSVPETAGEDRPAHRVEVAEVRLEARSFSAERPGTLEARRWTRLLSQEEGRITAVHAEEGDSVAEGELLVQLEDELLQAELKRAEAQRAQAEANLSRLERLAERELTSEEALSQARTDLAVRRAEQALLDTRLEYTRIRAPFQGTVTERHVEPGDGVGRFTHVMSLMDRDTLVARVNVSDRLAAILQPDDPVTIRIDALPETPLEGRIRRVFPVIDRESRQGTVEVILDDVPDGARPGQVARVTFTSEPVERRFVPFAALRRDIDGEHVFVVDDGGEVSRADVRTGMRLQDVVEVLEGVEAGERVVVRGFLGLRAGREVEVVDGDGA